jgi:transcription elongation factor Elf1
MSATKKSREEIMASVCAKAGLLVHYPFKCPGCGHELSATPSLAMLSGENHGAGTCPHCRACFDLRVEGGLREGTRMIATLHRYDEAPQRESLGEYDGACLAGEGNDRG